MAETRSRLTPEDRQTLRSLSPDWRITRPCFTPNARCRDLQARGLIELSNHEGRWTLRLTPLGSQIATTQGDA